MWLEQIWQAAVLGVLQGLTEFLPISSSAHLILLPWLLEWQPLGIVFDVVIHGGTLLAILIYFRQDWKHFIKDLLNRFRDPGLVFKASSSVDAILFGTLPAVISALVFRHWIEVYARTPLVTVVTLVLFGLLLWRADMKASVSRTFDSLRIADGLLIGLAQSLALVPGVSRSGITITAALFLGLSRADSARFSFLLAGPIIALGTLNGLFSILAENGAEHLSIPALVCGVSVSFVAGFLCIKYFLRFLELRTLLPFVLYRFLLAAVILVMFFMRQ